MGARGAGVPHDRAGRAAVCGACAVARGACGGRGGGAVVGRMVWGSWRHGALGGKRDGYGGQCGGGGRERVRAGAAAG